MVFVYADRTVPGYAYFQQLAAKCIPKRNKDPVIGMGHHFVLPYIKMIAAYAGYEGNYGNMEILGVCDWNNYGSFYYLSGFIGYLILAYYLKKYPLNWNWNKTLLIGIPLFLLGYLLTCYGYILTQKLFPETTHIWKSSGISPE